MKQSKKRKRRLKHERRVSDVATSPSTATVTVRIVPDMAGFKFSVLAKLIETEVWLNWWILDSQVKRDYRIELNALSRAISRAEWLAVSL
jgi:hypothetical protein